MVHELSYNDGVLLASLLYSVVDLASDWDAFSQCSRPIHHWLVVSYACVILFRGLHILGASAAANNLATQAAAGMIGTAGDFLLDLRQKGALPRAVVVFTWGVGLPFFMFWTGVGTVWLWHVVQETPQCMPATTQLWFSGLWLILCYVWLVIHVGVGAVALVLERRVRRAEDELRAIEDDDTRQRWGQVSHLPGYQAISGEAVPGAGAGLMPAEIKALPMLTIQECAVGAEGECPICITDIEPGDVVRRLPGCGHVFHRSCIDLWLLRRADCPLCKRSVRCSGEWV
mmetsp:Transcript_18120/g.51674  ORF Transcript_18120/g.51674 Transcript_18120/m.51674 type:complete len:286 (+) Transcript_18120:94-951(+)